MVSGLSTPDAVYSSVPSVRVRNAVLLIEDSENIVQLLRIIMKTLGLEVLWAQNGAEALQIFSEQQERVALVLTDCRLPDMDGREVCVRLRECNSELPILVTSGAVALTDVGALLKPGPLVKYLAKPYSPADVVTRVQQLLSHGRGREAEAGA